MSLAASLMLLEKYNACIGITDKHKEECSKQIGAPFVNVTDINKYFFEEKESYLKVYILSDFTNGTHDFPIMSNFLNFHERIEFTAKKPETSIFLNSSEEKTVSSTLTFNNCNISSKNDVFLIFAELRNCILNGEFIRVDILISDLKCTFNNIISTVPTYKVDFRENLSQNITIPFNFRDIKLMNINENITIAFSGDNFYIKSKKTKFYFGFSVHFQRINCEINNFIIDKVLISMYNMFISNMFINFNLNINIDKPCSFIMEDSGWEGASIRRIKVNQYSTTNFIFNCEVIPLDLNLMPDSQTTFYSKQKNTVMTKSIIIKHSYLCISPSYEIVGKSTFSFNTIHMYGDSSLDIDEDIMVVCRYLTSNEMKFIGPSVLGTIKCSGVFCKTAPIFIRHLILTDECILKIYKPYKVFIDYHETRGEKQIVSVEFPEKATRQEIEGSFLEIQETDNNNVYEIYFNYEVIVVDGKDHFIDCNIIRESTNNISFKAFIESTANEFKNTDRICIYENESYSDFCKDYITKLSQEEFDPNVFLQNAVFDNISLSIAGNVSNPVYGMNDVECLIHIIGLVPNNSYIYTNETILNLVCLQNVVLVHVPENKTSELTLFMLETIHGSVQSSNTVNIQLLKTWYIEDILVPNLYLTEYYKFGENLDNCTMEINNDYFMFNGHIISQGIFFNLEFFNTYPEADRSLNLYVYSSRTINFNFDSFQYINFFCYNSLSYFNFTKYQTVFFYTNILPRRIMFPKRFFLLSDETLDYYSEVILFGKEAEMVSKSSIVFHAYTVSFVGTEMFNIRNAVFDANKISTNKVMSNTLVINIINLSIINIDQNSNVRIRLYGTVKDLSLFICYTAGSIPFLDLNAEVDNLLLNMKNLASKDQLVLLYNDDVVNVSILKMHNTVKTFETNFFSSSWAFNNDTRLFDVDSTTDKDLVNYYLVNRIKEKDQEEEEGDINKKNMKPQVLLGVVIISCILLVVAIITTTIIYVKKYIIKTKVDKYTNALSDKLL